LISPSNEGDNWANRKKTHLAELHGEIETLNDYLHDSRLAEKSAVNWIAEHSKKIGLLVELIKVYRILHDKERDRIVELENEKAEMQDKIGKCHDLATVWCHAHSDTAKRANELEAKLIAINEIID
jgi:hypothetical protein